MRKLYFLSLLLILSSLSYLNGQRSIDQKNLPWSFSLSYAPKFEIRRPLSPHSEILFKSINIMTDRKIKNHFSFSFGLDYSQITKASMSLHFDGSVPISNDLIRISFTEFPIQLNYHFKNVSKRLDPFIKTSLRNVYLHQYYIRESSIELYTSKRDKYFLFCDFGVGSYLKIKDKLSFMFQASVGFGLKYNIPQYTYFEGLVGIRYSFTKLSNKPNSQSVSSGQNKI